MRQKINKGIQRSTRLAKADHCVKVLPPPSLDVWNRLQEHEGALPQSKRLPSLRGAGVTLTVHGYTSARQQEPGQPDARFIWSGLMRFSLM